MHARIRAALGTALALCLLAAAPRAGALDANTASAEALQAIRGIGPALSARIVEERDRRPFRDIADLKERVRGIGDANLARMRDAGLEVGPSGRVTATNGADAGNRSARPGGASAAGAAAARADDAARVPTFVGRPAPTDAAAAARQSAAVRAGTTDAPTPQRLAPAPLRSSAPAAAPSRTSAPRAPRPSATHAPLRRPEGS